MDPRCEETRELAAELALGIVEGEERGRALEHLADCPDCRRRGRGALRGGGRAAAARPAPRGPGRLRVPGAGRGAAAPRAASAAAGCGSCSRPPRRPLRPRPRSPSRSSRRTCGSPRTTGTPWTRRTARSSSPTLCAGRRDAHVGTVFSYEGSPSWVLHRRSTRAHRAGSDAPPSWSSTTAARCRCAGSTSTTPGSSGGSIPVDPKQRLGPAAAAGAPGTRPLIASSQLAPADREAAGCECPHLARARASAVSRLTGQSASPSQSLISRAARCARGSAAEHPIHREDPNLKICVLVKEVPDAAVQKRIDPETKRLDRTGEKNLNPFDTHAIEAAMQIKEGGAVDGRGDRRRDDGPGARRARPAQGRRARRRPLGAPHRRRARRLRRLRHRLRARPRCSRPRAPTSSCSASSPTTASATRSAPSSPTT